ncbi:LysE family translocator [Bartonella sp. CM31XJBT]|uniref:LysE family translocator n=1 Tax=Bartonella sp. CM31XJBT TaxID=3019090 RepID=UPI002362928B|nr:LysE family translocator [Bartonella sp. CM31XJBT]
MALIIDKATRLGRKNAFVNVLGLCTATYVHGAFSTPRCISAHSQQQNAVFLVKLMGGSYLLYMGFKSIKSGIHSLNSKERSSTNEKHATSETKLLTSYMDGFLTQILNPKVSIFYIAAFPKFLASGGGIKKGFELVTIHSFDIFAWFTLMTIFISFASTALKKQRVKGSINIATGTVLSLFSFFIFFG